MRQWPFIIGSTTLLAYAALARAQSTQPTHERAVELDLHAVVPINTVQQSFDADSLWRFTIEGTADGTHWATLVDRHTGITGRHFVDAVSGSYRKLRTTFIDAPVEAALRAPAVTTEATGASDLAMAADVIATASSTLADYPARAAIDGRSSSYWVAKDGSYPQKLSLDLGHLVHIATVEQAFKDVDDHAFCIEASADGTEWTMLLDASNRARGQMFRANGKDGAFRFVRLTCLGSTLGYWANSTTLKVFGFDDASRGDRNLSVGVSARASSSDGDQLPALAVDVDSASATHWRSDANDTSPWLTLDLGVACALSRVEQRFADTNTHRFRIEGSNDDARWTKLIDTTDGVAGERFSKAIEATVRYIRFVPLDAASATSVELNAFGTGSPRRDRWWESTSGVQRYYPKYYKTQLKQIAEELPELRRKGFGAIELATIYAGPPDVWAGLGATDNYNVDESIGTMADLDALIARGKETGIRILMFGNVGYARDTAPFFRKAEEDQRAGRASRERDWFHFRDTGGERWHWSERAHAYFFGFWGDNIPSYNFANAAWRDEASRYIRFWMDKGFDGFALDAPNVYDGITIDINNACLSNTLRNYDTWANSEGGNGPEYVRQWHYNSIQDYSLTNWGGMGFSSIIPAIRSGDPSGLENILKGNRDAIVAAGGITQTPPSWEIVDVPAEQRLLEIATLTTIGTFFYFHNGQHTLLPLEQIMPSWSAQQRDELFALIRTQNTHAALSPSGLRVKLPTNDDRKFYAFKRVDLSGNATALVVLNYQSTPQRMSVDLTGVGIATKQTPINLITGEPAAPIDAATYALDLPAYGYAILGVNESPTPTRSDP